MSKRVRYVVGAGVVVLATVLAPVVAAEPVPTPPPIPGSSNDELTDMVMEAIQGGSPAAPSTTAVPAPPS